MKPLSNMIKVLALVLFVCVSTSSYVLGQQTGFGRREATISSDRVSKAEKSEEKSERVLREEYEQLHTIILNDYSDDLVDLKTALNSGVSPCATLNGTTILHFAVGETKRPGVVQMLLDYGADPNAVDSKGETPLRLSITGAEDDDEIASILCDYGADVNRVGIDGRTPLDVAIDQDATRTGKILREYGAKCAMGGSNMGTATWVEIMKCHQTKFPKHAGLTKRATPTDASQSNSPQGSTIPGLGTPKKRENALKGIMLDLKRSARGDILASTSGSDTGKRRLQLRTAMTALDTGWNIEALKKKYRVAPTTLYTTSIFIADEKGNLLDVNKVTAAFRNIIEAPGWLCYYEGYFSVTETGNYRFVGMGDDAMIVGVDRKTVLYAFYPGEGHGPAVRCGKDWEPTNFCGKSGNDGREMRAYGAKGHRNMLYKGSWLYLTSGRPYHIQIAFGDASGKATCAFLGIQKKGRDTDDNFPLFTLERVSPSSDLQISETGKYNTSSVFSSE